MVSDYFLRSIKIPRKRLNNKIRLKGSASLEARRKNKKVRKRERKRDAFLDSKKREVK